MRLRETTRMQRAQWAVLAAILAFAVLAPLFVSGYFAHSLLTLVYVYGIAAASLIFLSAYGGMISLCQVSLYGISGFVLGNTVTTAGTKGLALGLDPWVGIVLAVVITTAIGVILGAVASRSFGIYFLMLTLAFAVLTNSFFGQVTLLSGFSGISGIQGRTPSVVGNPNVHPNRLYYIALVASALVYLLMRYLVRTPFGFSLQGIRDDPVRMASLGYTVPLHRTLAFAFGAFVASIAGVLYVWYYDHIDPTSIDLSAVLDLLIIAVIGGMFRLEGAWLGAFVFVIMQNYVRDIPGLGHIGISQERFHTVIGVIFLVIVLLSPGGLLGVWEWLTTRRPWSRTGAAVTTAGPSAGPGETNVPAPGG